MLDIHLEPDHPAPLYYQIATAIRWKIGTGALRPGDTLPPMRSAAREWGVSYHTVRRAYAELGRIGLVQPRRGDGTRVLASSSSADGSAAPGVEEFIRTFVAEALGRYSLSALELARRIESAARAGAPEATADETRGPGVSITVVECNDHQARDLAEQLERQCAVSAVPWHLSRDGEPPEGLIVGTRFHQGEMLKHWPHRADDMEFAAIRLDEAVARRIRSRPGNRDEIVVVERDVGTGHAHAADIRRALGESAHITVSTSLPALEELDRSRALHVIAPRLHDSVASAIREHRRVVLSRYVFDSEDLDRIRRRLAQEYAQAPG